MTSIDVISPLVQQIKRFFKAASLDSGVGGHANLRLEDGKPHKRSEVQTYMALYYNSHIWDVVLEHWPQTKDKVAKLGSEIMEGLPESELSPEETVVFGDMKIPITFKNMVTQDLWENEEESIKRHVRLHCEAKASPKTVYNTEGEERKELLNQYAK